MSKYQDKNGMWHARDISKGGKDANVFIYGAYAKALGLDVSGYEEYFAKCVVNLDRDNITINRHPRLAEPVFSFDETMGAIFLNLIPYDIIKGNHFCFVGHGQRLDSRIFEKFVKAMLEMVVAQNVNIFMSGKAKVKQRNLWWRHNLENVKYFATRLNPAQTYVVKKYNNRKYHIEEEKLWAFFRDVELNNKADSHGEYSRKNLLWLMLLMNGDFKRAKKMKPWIYFEKYFGKDHDFTKAIKKKYGL